KKTWERGDQRSGGERPASGDQRPGGKKGGAVTPRPGRGRRRSQRQEHREHRGRPRGGEEKRKEGFLTSRTPFEMTVRGGERGIIFWAWGGIGVEPFGRPGPG